MKRISVFALLFCLVFLALSPVFAHAAPILYGDVDADGALGIGDVTLLAKAVAGWANLPAFPFEAADVWQDGELTIADITAIAKAVAGWAITLPVLPEEEDRGFTVFIVGDSTACLYLNPDQSVMTQDEYRDIMGWGYYLDRYFAQNISFVNLASSGASTRTYLTLDKYQTLLSEVSEGDYVLIQLGHNDDNVNYKGTDPTLDWHEADPATCLVEGAALPSYQAILYYKYIVPIVERGATPVLASPITKRNPPNGAAYFSRHKPFTNALISLCEELNLTYLPMMEETSAYWNGVLSAHGASATASLHAYADESRTGTDNTHLSHFGAYVVASLYADALCDKLDAFAQNRLSETLPFEGVMPDWYTAVAPPRVWVMGDSTALIYYKKVDGENVVTGQDDGRDLMGWSRYLSSCFDPSVTVIDAAHSGTSTRSYAGAGLAEGSMIEYRKVLNESKEGDYAIIQFGHNDETASGAYAYKGTIVPDAAKGIDFDWHDADPVTCMVEGYDRPSYCAILYYYYIKLLQEKGVTPVLASPIARLGASARNADIALHLPYAAALEALAEEFDLTYLPMTENTAAYWNETYTTYGASATESLHAYSDESRTSFDRTHLSHFGAYVVAGLYADALCEKLPVFARYLNAEPEAFDGITPAWAAV